MMDAEEDEGSQFYNCCRLPAAGSWLVIIHANRGRSNYFYLPIFGIPTLHHLLPACCCLRLFFFEISGYGLHLLYLDYDGLDLVASGGDDGCMFH
jgi:hypothetical protein